MMAGVKVFFDAYRYLANCLRKSISTLDPEDLQRLFKVLLSGKKNTIIVDGKGRSLQSALLMEDCLEHNGFSIILPASNANLRPWKPDDIFFFNSGSGSGSTIKHAEKARDDGLKVIGMTYNEELKEEFPDVVILKPSQNRNPVLAPLGTEFEFSTAVIGSLLGYAVNDTPEKSVKNFFTESERFFTLFEETISEFECNIEPVLNFIQTIASYIHSDCGKKIYFRGVGRDAIINRVAAIRYGHLYKEPDFDLKVIYEGHWDLRSKGDLAIITSGSGSTTQSLNYAMQAYISGMDLFGITSFKDSDLGKFTGRAGGCLVIRGRKNPYSMYNLAPESRLSYLPEFELNTYLTLDALLAQIASDFKITEEDMQAAHRAKILE